MLSWKSLVLSSLLVLTCTSVASAGDLCLNFGSGNIKFTKAKLKPGKATALVTIHS